MQEPNNAISLQRTISDMCAEYADKDAAMDQAVATFQAAWDALGMASTIQGTYSGPISRNTPFVYAKELRLNLRRSGWKAVYNRLRIAELAPASDRVGFEATINGDPPPLDFETVRATFGPYIADPRGNILRGLAEVFVKLDPAYRSHSKVKIGVAGLPKRLIISNVGSYGSYGRERVIDIMRALSTYRGAPLFDQAELKRLDALDTIWGHKAGVVAFDGSHHSTTKDGVETPSPDRGVTVKKFANGNAHIIFSPQALLDINRGLAEFYGDILPDVEEPDAKRQPGTAVAKDLQFYWTPAKVIRKLLDDAGIPDPKDAPWRDGNGHLTVLEPSCGDGRILDALRERGVKSSLGIEVHAGRVHQAKGKGHNVILQNFLEVPPEAFSKTGTGTYDFVVLNPPFYGKHYAQHVRHALRFLKPGGTLAAILPATARYDHDDLSDLITDYNWTDHPVGSFAEAGTNVCTGHLVLRVTGDRS